MATDPRYAATAEVAHDLKRSAALLPSAMLLVMMRLAQEYRTAHQIAEHAVMDARPLGARLSVEVLKIGPGDPTPAWLEITSDFPPDWVVALVVGSPTCEREVGFAVGTFREEAMAQAFAHFVAVYIADVKGLGHTLPASPFSPPPPPSAAPDSN